MTQNKLANADQKIRPTRHICIATGQNLANLIPAVQLGATDVIILETSEMTESAKFLSKALKSRNITSQKIYFDDSSPEKIQESALKIATGFGQGKIVFNATGGHKLMTLALATQLKMADELHVLYVETKKLRFDWLEPEAEMVGMQNVLKINDFLQVHGYSQKANVQHNETLKEVALQRKSLTKLLGDESEKLGRFFGTLNLLAHRALPKNDFGIFNASQSLDFAPGGLAAEVLKKAQEIGLISLNAYGDEITFTNEDSAKYFGGQWLEEYVASKLQGIQPFDYATGLVIQKNGTEIANECDAVVVHNNRFLLIECKTLKFGFDATKDADYIYKLSQLSNKIGGLFASKLLLSARLVPEEVKQRAKDYGVQILDASEVKNLVSFINNWKNS